MEKVSMNFLKEKNGKYSQGRLYLCISIVIYYLTQGVILFAGMFSLDVDQSILASVADAIEYPMTLFATYTLGGKAVDVFKKKDKEDEDNDTQIR